MADLRVARVAGMRSGKRGQTVRLSISLPYALWLRASSPDRSASATVQDALRLMVRSEDQSVHNLYRLTMGKDSPLW